MGFFQFKREQLLKISVEKAWDFISDPKNLQVITPDEMGFEILSDSPDRMYPGLIIKYRVSPLFGIKTTWVTEITHVKDKEYFVDEQRVGPYKIWHHQHWLKPHSDGVQMYDIVSYQPPLGILGNVANGLIIKNKLEQIFNYREKVLEDLFNK